MAISPDNMLSFAHMPSAVHGGSSQHMKKGMKTTHFERQNNHAGDNGTELWNTLGVGDKEEEAANDGEARSE